MAQTRQLKFLQAQDFTLGAGSEGKVVWERNLEISNRLEPQVLLRRSKRSIEAIAVHSSLSEGDTWIWGVGAARCMVSLHNRYLEMVGLTKVNRSIGHR
jgi:hypothetical protein